jgi:hypothetical protein
MNDLACGAGVCTPRGVIEVSPDHRTDSSGEIERLRLVGDPTPVAQDHDPIGNAPDVCKAMGDVENTDAAPPQSIDNSEQAVGLRSRQARGRFVKDEHGSFGGDGPGNRDQLAMRRAECAEVLVERRVKPDARGDLSRLPGNPAPRDNRARAAATKRVKHQVLGDGQARNTKLVGRLVNDDDPCGPRGLRRGEA